jgi:intracellular septation protein A
MPTLFAPLLKQFALLEHPIRYFLYRFIIALGAIRLIGDLSLIFFNKEFLSEIKVTALIFLLAILFFISEYFQQKKLKRISTQTNAT